MEVSREKLTVALVANGNYYFLLGVGRDGEFVTKTWQTDDPGVAAELRCEADDTLCYKTW